MSPAVIVVVDDSITNRSIFSRLSRSIADAASVQSFSDPQTMLAWAGGNSPDLIITDYKMPGLDGAEFVARLRTLPLTRDVPIMVITAYEDREFRLRALEAGATDFLLSPVDHHEFVTRGRNLLHLGQQQRLVRMHAQGLERELELSERSRASAIHESRTRLLQVIDTIPAVISAVDAQGRRVFINRCGADLLADQLASKAAALEPVDAAILSSGMPVLGFEESITDRDGAPRTLLTSKFPLRDDVGEVVNILTTSFDITERKRAEQALFDLAHHDALTGLPNRLFLNAKLAAELAQAARTGQGFALHFIDLDRFKSINDGFGHDQGDGLLKEVAERLLRAVGDSGAVARLGGDEFAIIQTGVHDAGLARGLAEKVIAAIREPVLIERRRVRIGASIGVTLAPTDAETVEQLLKCADLAMYRAKREGKDCARFFKSEMQISARVSVLLEIDLRQGIEQRDLRMFYQPQVDVQTREITGVEALLRWQRTGHGLVTPGAFLSLAEDTGLIVSIDQWALHETCRQAAAWSDQGRPVRVAVNVSSKTFKAGSIRSLVMDALRSTGLSPTLLELELTESTLMEDHHAVRAELHALRTLGVRVAIDDFGTGYSSLAYLQSLPVDRLKIDGSFVRKLGKKPSGAAIVTAVAAIGRSLGMDVLAEGVETLAQLQQVRDAGCQGVQGYLFSPAVVPGKLGEMLAPGAGRSWGLSA